MDKRKDDCIILILVWVLEVILLKICWNYLMPYLFNLPVITYWQSFVLSVLCGGLFQNPVVSLRLRNIEDKLYEN